MQKPQDFDLVAVQALTQIACRMLFAPSALVRG
jgi:hypothetical protein